MRILLRKFVIIMTLLSLTSLVEVGLFIMNNHFAHHLKGDVFGIFQVIPTLLGFFALIIFLSATEKILRMNEAETMN